MNDAPYGMEVEVNGGGELLDGVHTIAICYYYTDDEGGEG